MSFDLEKAFDTVRLGLCSEQNLTPYAWIKLYVLMMTKTNGTD